MIQINTHSKRQLPYIQIQNPPMKLLIDTGANQSFLSPEVVKRFYPNYQKNYEPFSVTNVHCTTQHKFTIDLPLFEEFNTNEFCKFHIYKFHNVFDGLIGLDLLQKLKASVNLSTKQLITEHAKNPILMMESGVHNLFEAMVKSNSTNVLKLPVKAKNGEILIPETKINQCTLPALVTTANQGYALVEISNPTCNDIIISIDSPLKTIPLSNNFECYSFETPLPKPQNIESLLRTDHMNLEEKQKITKLCKEYSDIFYYEDCPLTFTNNIKHRIRTTDEIPVYTKSYRYPHIHKAEVQSQIDKMLQQKIIQPSESPWSSPIWIVPKKQDASGQQKWRLVVDYRKLNEKTISDKYPIPVISDVLDKLGRCQYFTTLDLKSGFHQIEMFPDDIQKTAFTVENGHYEYCRMPFGLKNAPSTFQRAMENVLRGLNDICEVYMDDIIIFSTSLQEHIVSIEKVFQRLREANLKIQLDKSEFLKHETAYLGHIVTPQGIKPNPDKVRAIKKFPIPKTPKEIKSFLGLVGYYRKFIPNFSKLTKPLTSCLKKGAKIDIDNQKYINAFRICQEILMNDPILQYPDFDKDFNLTTDASNYAIGAVLSQGPIGSDKPIAYASRTLNDSEINYNTTEKELLAIVWATKYFRPYIFGRKFNIITDHKPLQWLMSIKEPNSRLTRWRLKLEEFEYRVIHKSGKNNTNADALSRVEIHNNDTESPKNQDTPESPNNPGSISSDTLDNLLSIMGNTSSIPDIPDLEQLEIPNDDDTVHTNLEQPILNIPISETSLNTQKSQIIIQFVLHSPNEPKIKEIFPGKNRISAQIGINNLRDDIINFFKHYIRPDIRHGIYLSDFKYIPDVTKILQEVFKNSAYDLTFCKIKLQDVTDKDEQYRLAKGYHESKSNHRGIQETEKQLKRSYYWPNLCKTITEIINNCSSCQINKYERHPNKQSLQFVPVPTKPFETIHVDTFQVKGQKFLTIIDTFSKYAQAYPLESMSGVCVLNSLVIWMTHHGLPLSVTADQGTEFKNLPLKEFAALHKINLHYTSVNNPQSNGAIERFHSTILEHIRLLQEKHKQAPITELMLFAVLAYNNSIHSSTDKKPIEIINGHLDNRDPFDLQLEKSCLQNYISKHKEMTTDLYAKINEKLNSKQISVINKRNEPLEPPLDYEEGHAFYSSNPLAARHKDQPRYVTRNVSKNLGIKVSDHKGLEYHKRNIRRPLKMQHSLLQDDGMLPSTSRGSQTNVNDE